MLPSSWRVGSFTEQGHVLILDAVMEEVIQLIYRVVCDAHLTVVLFILLDAVITDEL
jgi:hypothetical protein